MIAETIKQFWSAAFFYRRAPDRNRDKAILVLNHVRNTATGKVQSRAANLLKEIEHDTDNPPGPRRA